MYYGTGTGWQAPASTLVPYDAASPVTVMRDALPATDLWHIMAQVQHSAGQPATTYGVDGSIVESRMRTSLAHPSLVLENSAMLDAKVVAIAKTKYKTKLTNLGARWDIMSYPVAGEFVLHHDSGYHDGTKVVTTQNRKISAVLYINSQGAGYLGGDIEFPYFADSATGDTLTLHPESGMLVVFPSNYAFSHVVKPVTAGLRVCAVKFFS